MWGIICDVGVPPVAAGEGFPPGFLYLRSSTGGSIFRSSSAATSGSCSGPEYVEYVMNWVDKEINNEVLFPTNAGRKSLTLH